MFENKFRITMWKYALITFMVMPIIFNDFVVYGKKTAVGVSNTHSGNNTGNNSGGNKNPSGASTGNGNPVGNGGENGNGGGNSGASSRHNIGIYDSIGDAMRVSF